MVILQILSFLLFGTFLCATQHISNDINNIADNQGPPIPKILSLRVRSDVVYRFAETTVRSTMVNDDGAAREAVFDVNLPEAAFISNFSLEIDNTVYPGIVKEKEVARKEYDKAKRKGLSAARITAKHRATNKFRVAINLAAWAEVSFVLTYDELLRRKRGQYEHTLYINPNQLVPDLLVEVFIYESREITALRIPPLRNDILNAVDTATSNELAVVERPSPKSAYIRYSPSIEDQKLASEQGVSGLFIVQYDVQRSLDAGDIYIVNGYFTHFFAPVGLEPLRKRILFVLDVSGSMSFDRKIEQVKAAMIHILQDLNEEDLFNIITFEGASLSWSDTMRKATVKNVELATDMIKSLVAEGGTNVNEALIDAVDILQGASGFYNTDAQTSPLIVFLTDGDPTVGETNFKRILDNVEKNNRENIQIFSLSFGDDANFNFLKKISSRNNAFARKIYTDSDAAVQLTDFYEEISNVLMSNVSFHYLDNTVNLTSVTQWNFPSFFDGSELVVAGRLVDDADFNSLTMAVSGTSEHGILELSATTSDFNTIRHNRLDFKTTLEFETITEKMWAYLTIRKLMEEKLKTENTLKKRDLQLDAIKLAIKYNFVTPVTSMVVVKPEVEKQNATSGANDLDIQDDDYAATAPEGSYRGNAALSSPFGPQGLSGKPPGLKLPPGLADSDPHFIVKVKGLDKALCFDVMATPGDTLQLIKDKYSGVMVYAKIVANAPKNKTRKRSPAVKLTNTQELKTFLGEVFVKRWHFNVTFTPQTIRVNNERVEWKNGSTFSHGKTRIVVDQAGSMVAVLFRDRIALLVMRHLRTAAQQRAGKVDFLGFYIVEERGMSSHTHGLIGQFLHRHIVLKKSKKTRQGKTLGRLRISGNTTRARKVMATLGHRLNLATNTTVPCWMVQHNGGKLIDGQVEDYLVKKNVF